MKKLLSLILLTTSASVAIADDANWKIHPIFDEEVTHVVETPDYVYFTSMNSRKTPDFVPNQSLFRYDKKGEELVALSTSNFLNGNNINDIIYNPQKGYLAILYHDYSLDLLYNNGNITYIPQYSQSSLSYPKDVNQMSIDPENDRIYLATDFGYVAVNDKKNEIAQSRIYGEPFKAFCRLGNDYLALQDNQLLSIEMSSPGLSLDQYDIVDTFESPYGLYPSGSASAILLTGEPSNSTAYMLKKNGQKYETEELFNGRIYNVEYTTGGLVVTTGDTIYLVKDDGTVTFLERHKNFLNSAAVTKDLSEIWYGSLRKGLSSTKYTGGNWSLTRDWMLPNAPSTFITTSFINHPDKGLLMLNYGYGNPTVALPSNNPLQVSGYKNGRWTNYGTYYTNPGRAPILTSPTGMILDPDNKSYVYITSYHNGIMRLNLNDPNDIIHVAREGDSDNGKPGFAVLDGVPESVPNYANIARPFFDKQGNLWMGYADWDDRADPNPHLYCWTAADRKATTQSDVYTPKIVEFDVYATQTNMVFTLPLLYTGNGLIVYCTSLGNLQLVLLDTNGTPLDTTDDKTYSFADFVDSDGNSISISPTNFLWEDPSTGYVWICHGNGVCYFVPSQVRNGTYVLNRVKVPRNDGTNLADYLLDGVSVNHLAVDSEGRKWFSTAGGGVVCTSADGREIIEEFTTENSPLPDDMVYGIGYNSQSNSLLISTNLGYAEYSLPVSQNSSTKEDVRAYPNPVRPDYSGFVTITDIPTGSFVKIVDSAGNLVKELGIVSGFDILWDVSDSNFKRVRSGVYHIMVSPSNENSSYATVGKILVMS